MTGTDFATQIEELEELLRALSHGPHPLLDQERALSQKHGDQAEARRRQKEAAIQECHEKRSKGEFMSQGDYDDCLRDAEEAYQKWFDGWHPGARSEIDQHHQKRVNLQEETIERIKSLREQAQAAQAAHQLQEMEKMQAEAAKAYLNMAHTAPIEVLQEMEPYLAQYPPEVQKIIKARLEAEMDTFFETEDIVEQTGKEENQFQLPAEEPGDFIGRVNSLPVDTLVELEQDIDLYSPEVQDAIRARLYKERINKNPDALAGPDLAEQVLDLVDGDILEQIRELDPHTVNVTTKVLDGLLEIASGRKAGDWVETTKKVKKSVDTFVKIVSDKNYNSDAALVATRELGVVVGEMLYNTAKFQTVGKVKSVGDLMLLAVRENVRAIWGDQVAKGLPNDFYDAVKMIADSLPESDGILDPGPAWKYWSGNPLDPQV